MNNIKDTILNSRTKAQTTLDFVPSAVFFDLNSTILDTMKSDLNSLRETLGIDKDAPLNINDYKKDGQTLYNSLGADAKSDLSMRYMMDISSGRVPLFPDALETLSTLKKLNIPVGVITNRNKLIADGIKKKYPMLYDLIDAWLFPLRHKDVFKMESENNSDLQNVFEKPNPVTLQLALRELQNQPPIDENILFVGDAKSDVLFAERCGITPILFYSETSTISPEFISIRPGLKIVANHTELKNMIISASRNNPATIAN